MNKKRLYAFSSRSIFPWNLALILTICQLQLDISSVSASTRLWVHSLDTNTILPPPAVCPPSIGFGETIQCSIGSAGEIDSYTFTANTGDRVLVRLSSNMSSIVPDIRVYSPGGTKLCQASNSYPAEIASCDLSSPGTYSILVDDLLGTRTGDYYLYLQRLNNPGSPVSINFGQTMSTSISTPAEMDTYTFSANAGDKVLVRLSSNMSSIIPDIRVYSPAGTKLCQAYNSYPAEIASCDISSTGTYTILVDDLLGTKTGDYYLFLQRLNNPGSPVSINFCQTMSGSISTPAEMDTYTFPAIAGDKVLVRLSTNMSSIVPDVRVYSPDGTKLCQAYNSYPAEIASCDLASTGTYSILVDDLLAINTGDYYLYLQNLINPACPVPIFFPLIIKYIN